MYLVLTSDCKCWFTFKKGPHFIQLHLSEVLYCGDYNPWNVMKLSMQKMDRTCLFLSLLGLSYSTLEACQVLETKTDETCR